LYRRKNGVKKRTNKERKEGWKEEIKEGLRKEAKKITRREGRSDKVKEWKWRGREKE
jgi:hypothetical protein